MKINRKITILFLLCLFGLGILWYVGDVSEKLRDRLKKSSDAIELLAFERALLLDNAMLHFKYNDIQLPDLQLYTIEGDSLCLSDVLDDEYKLLIRFSYLHCSSCIHELFNGLSQIMEKFPSNRVLLIGTYQNQRTFDAFMTNYSLSYPIYWSNKKENILEK